MTDQLHPPDRLVQRSFSPRQHWRPHQLEWLKHLLLKLEMKPRDERCVVPGCSSIDTLDRNLPDSHPSTCTTHSGESCIVPRCPLTGTRIGTSLTPDLHPAAAVGESCIDLRCLTKVPQIGTSLTPPPTSIQPASSLQWLVLNSPAFLMFGTFGLCFL